MLFLLLIIITIDIPTYTGAHRVFIGFENLAKKNIIPLVSLGFLFLGFVFWGRFKYKLEGSKKTPFRITKIENVNYEHLTFLTTYIIPLICFDLNNIKYAIVLMALLIIIGIIYVKTDMFYANPSLALLGYHIYKVDGAFRTEERQDIILIARERLTLNMKVSYKRLDEKIYFVRRV